MSVSSQDSMEIKHYDLDPIEEFEQLYGTIYHYKIDEIYKLVYKEMKWPVLEVIGLFEALKNECMEEAACNDDYEVRTLIKIKVDQINSFITFLEHELR